MYRHRVKKAPSPVFGDTLEAMQYSINEQRKLIDADGKTKKEIYMAPTQQNNHNSHFSLSRVKPH